MLISYWIPHWLLFDVLYTLLFLYFHSYSLHRWSANQSLKLWSISTKTSILCVVNVGSSRLIWAVVYCNVCNRLVPCCFGRISFAIWIVWDNDCVCDLNTREMETWQEGPSYNGCLTNFEISDMWDIFWDKHDMWGWLTSGTPMYNGWNYKNQWTKKATAQK